MKIIPYSEPLHREAYERLCREWIEREFWVEPYDLAIFSSPKKFIVDKGGFAVMAEHEGELVGTCSAILIEPGIFELAKLGVKTATQGLGIGKLLCEKIIAEAYERGAHSVLITTNTKLTKAMQLYEKLGFIEAPKSFHAHYQRCNKSLILHLNRGVA